MRCFNYYLRNIFGSLLNSGLKMAEKEIENLLNLVEGLNLEAYTSHLISGLLKKDEQILALRDQDYLEKIFLEGEKFSSKYREIEI